MITASYHSNGRNYGALAFSSTRNSRKYDALRGTLVSRTGQSRKGDVQEKADAILKEMESAKNILKNN
jgi:hypothetical protein